MASARASLVIMALASCSLLLGAVPSARAECEGNEAAAFTAPEGTGWQTSGALFGFAVATDGPTVVAGAIYDGEDGGQAGAVYVHRWNGSTWVRETKVRPSDGNTNGHFGMDVALFDDTLVVGSNLGPRYPQALGGAAYVFRNNPIGSPTWVQEAKLVPADSSPGDSFSEELSLYGDVAVIAGYLKDDPGENCGSAYVFRRDDNGTPNDPSDDTWSQEAKLVPADLAAGDYFGYSAAVWGDFAMVASVADDDLGHYSGSVYVFRWTGSAWVQHQKLLASDGQVSDHFGVALALSENWAMISANGDDDLAHDAGAVYAFERDDNGTPGNSADDTWIQRAKLYAADPGLSRALGGHVAISGDLALFSAYGAGFVEPNPAYLFRYDAQSPSYWVQQATLVARQGIFTSYGPVDVALAGDTAVTGIARYYLEEEDRDMGWVFVYRGLQADCNGNETIDFCDIADGTSQDQNTNGLPDECEPGIPTLSTWGSIALVVLMLTGGVIVTTRRRAQAG